jgi:hypothetical protein
LGTETRPDRERRALLVEDRFLPVARFRAARFAPVAVFFAVRRFADFLVAAIPSSIIGEMNFLPSGCPDWANVRR